MPSNSSGLEKRKLRFSEEEIMNGGWHKQQFVDNLDLSAHHFHPATKFLALRLYTCLHSSQTLFPRSLHRPKEAHLWPRVYMPVLICKYSPLSHLSSLSVCAILLLSCYFWKRNSTDGKLHQVARAGAVIVIGLMFMRQDFKIFVDIYRSEKKDTIFWVLAPLAKQLRQLMLC